MVRGKERRGTYDYEVYLQQEDDDESAILSHACLWGNLSSTSFSVWTSFAECGLGSCVGE